MHTKNDQRLHASGAYPSWSDIGGGYIKEGGNEVDVSDVEFGKESVDAENAVMEVSIPSSYWFQ